MDKLLLREIRLTQPYLQRVGSKEAGQGWKEVADGLNQCEGFIEMPRDQRSVRERFSKLMAEFKSKIRKEEAESGTSPEPLDENEVLLQEIAEIAASVKNEKGVNNTANQKKDREKALAVREVAMRTWVKNRTSTEDSETEEEGNEATCAKPKGGRGRKRRRGSDALHYLEVKSTADAEIKREELTLRKQQLEIQQRQTEQQQQRQEQLQMQMLHQQQQLQQQADQQQRQFMQQQQQFQQQVQAQTQTQNLILTLLQKMTGGQ